MSTTIHTSKLNDKALEARIRSILDDAHISYVDIITYDNFAGIEFAPNVGIYEDVVARLCDQFDRPAHIRSISTAAGNLYITIIED